jgi:hypothetical protein
MVLGCRRMRGGIEQVRLGTTCGRRCWRCVDGMIAYVRYLPIVALRVRCGPDALIFGQVENRWMSEVEASKDW